MISRELGFFEVSFSHTVEFWKADVPGFRFAGRGFPKKPDYWDQLGRPSQEIMTPPALLLPRFFCFYIILLGNWDENGWVCVALKLFSPPNPRPSPSRFHSLT